MNYLVSEQRLVQLLVQFDFYSFTLKPFSSALHLLLCWVCPFSSLLLHQITFVLFSVSPLCAGFIVGVSWAFPAVTAHNHSSFLKRPTHNSHNLFSLFYQKYITVVVFSASHVCVISLSYLLKLCVKSTHYPRCVCESVYSPDVCNYI